MQPKNVAQKFMTGFTLIELLVAISIIGILAALLVANMVGLRERADDAKNKNDVRQLKTALQLFYNDNQSYPTNIGDYMTGNSFQDGSAVYMKDVPDNIDYSSTGPDNFLLTVELANAGDEDICRSAEKCGQSCTARTSTQYYECSD